MKTLYVLMLFAAAMATVAAFPPLGSLVGLPSFGGSDDTYDDYDDVDFLADNNTNTVSTDDISSDMSSEPSTEDPSTTTEETPSGGDDDEGLSGGAIAGIVIGSIAGVALIAGGVYYLKVKGMLCFD